MYSARYLGVGMRYEDGICAIVISTTGAFKWCPSCCRLNFNPKYYEKPWIIAFVRVQFLAKIWRTLRSTFRTLFERSFHADHNGTVPSFISHSCIKIRCVLHLTVDTWPFQIRQFASPLSEQRGKLSCARAYILHVLNLKLVHTCTIERRQWHNYNLQLAVG